MISKNASSDTINITFPMLFYLSEKTHIVSVLNRMKNCILAQEHIQMHCVSYADQIRFKTEVWS